MKMQIVSINPFQTAKVLAVIYFAVSIPLLVMMSWPMLIGLGPRLPALLILLMPFVYGIAGFVITLLVTWVYNLVAPQIGGVEFTTSQSG